ncbi:MAG TPA: cysteine--tRNA ligase [Roseomonas sp.]|nr:cysteine--tRNA ligase [Roseomonas sp.]
MKLELTNTMTRRKDVFRPADPGRVTMYVCGPTVYNYAHIGNARPAVVFDVLFRLLRRTYGNVVYARNFTDVDDKINAAALERHEPIQIITARYIDAYHADMAALGVLDPVIEPRVTDHIPQIIDLISRLIAQGHAYVAEGHVLFHVPSFPTYGQLSRRNREDMIAGARVEVAPFKRDPADFVLWKPSSPELPRWDSPWGRGRPGWHIECSAMIEHHLGGPIDIHGGGQDLMFPHHENEIAQGTRAQFWIHNGFVTVDGRKMSKSLGNVLLVRDLLAQAPGEAIRLALLAAHYRQPLDWSSEALGQAKQNLDRLYGVLRDLRDVPATGGTALAGPILAALADDLNTPAALAELLALGKRARAAAPSDAGALKGALLEAGSSLGLLQQDPQAWFQFQGDDPGGASTARIEDLIARRAAAREARDFATADRIRAELEAEGVLVEDRAGGSSWRRAG